MGGRKYNPKALAGELPAEKFLEWLDLSSDIFDNITNLVRDKAYLTHPEGIKPTSNDVPSTKITVEYKSQAVLDAEANGKELFFGKDLTWEHCVPCAAFANIVKDNYSSISNKNAKEFMDRYYHVCLVTKEEDAKLKKAGLNERMPKNWKFDMTAKDNEWERYKAVGIVPVKQKMHRPVPVYTIHAVKTGDGKVQTKDFAMDILKMQEVYGKSLPGGGLPIGATSTAIEKNWLWIVVDYKEV